MGLAWAVYRYKGAAIVEWISYADGVLVCGTALKQIRIFDLKMRISTFYVHLYSRRVGGRG